MTATLPDQAIGQVEQLVRYPVKGLGGTETPTVDLVAGRGLPYDRCLAMSNGSAHVPAGEWTACPAFYRLAKNAELTAFSAQLTEGDGASVTITGPGGGSVRVRVDDPEAQARDIDAAETAVQAWLPPGPLGPTRLVGAGVSLWDHRDAMLSIINLATLAQLADVSDRVVDRRRFRANVYVSGLEPWEELALVGRRLQLGDAVVEIVRPIDRCRATAVDPSSGEVDLNIPALLAMHFGHMFCGVYARVVGSGRVSVADRVLDLGSAPSSVEAGIAASTAPPLQDWPRPVVVVDRPVDGGRVRSLWLRDALGAASQARPGQHVRLHTSSASGRPVWRCYTVSGVDGSDIRISVKREADGAMSTRLHDEADPPTPLMITGPFGDTTLDLTSTRPVVLVSAGIGLTPTVAMLRALRAAGSRRAVTVVHVDRGVAGLPLWAEVEELVAELPAARIHLFLTRATTAECEGAGAIGRRPGVDDFHDVIEDCGEDAAAFVCGPADFLVTMRKHLVSAGIADDDIRHEVFFSPMLSSLEPTRPPLPGPFAVRFVPDGPSADWQVGAGTLLDLAESVGLALPAGCRSGACGTCAQRLRGGETAYVVEPVLPPPDGTVLLCCSVPVTPVQLDVR